MQLAFGLTTWATPNKNNVFTRARSDVDSFGGPHIRTGFKLSEACNIVDVCFIASLMVHKIRPMPHIAELGYVSFMMPPPLPGPNILAFFVRG